ncbi:MAG: hypothetical protein II393_01600 [Cytophagales bacterium]|nr:hypothetical protein [Cytophagales bacterium]
MANVYLNSVRIEPLNQTVYLIEHREEGKTYWIIKTHYRKMNSFLSQSYKVFEEALRDYNSIIKTRKKYAGLN